MATNVAAEKVYLLAGEELKTLNDRMANAEHRLMALEDFIRPEAARPDPFDAIAKVAEKLNGVQEAISSIERAQRSTANPLPGLTEWHVDRRPWLSNPLGRGNPAVQAGSDDFWIVWNPEGRTPPSFRHGSREAEELRAWRHRLRAQVLMTNERMHIDAKRSLLGTIEAALTGAPAPRTSAEGGL